MESSPLISSQIPLPKEDSFIYDFEIFAFTPKKFFSDITAYYIPIKTSSFLYYLNIRRVYSSENSKNPSILYLHGHGSSCTWTTWLKMAFLLYEKGFNAILLDLPGYGKSRIEGETRINPKLYINDAPHMFAKLFEILLANEKNKKIIGVGFCGGAANIIRTINEYPSFFAKRHILHNSVIGQIPDCFEKNLEKFQIKVWVSWSEDIDHSHLCVGYKYFNKKRKEGSKFIFLREISNEELYSNQIWGKNMGRKTSNIMIFEPSSGYLEFVIGFLDEGKEFLPVYVKKIENKMEDVIEKIKSMSLKEVEAKDDEDEELKMVLALSLQQK